MAEPSPQAETPNDPVETAPSDDGGPAAAPPRTGSAPVPRDGAPTVPHPDSFGRQGTGPRHPATADYRDGAARTGTAGRPVQAGDTLNGRFLLEEVIAVGGMGVVYKAKDLMKLKGGVKDARLALKMLSESFRQHPEAWKSLLNETEKTRNLSHPNIIKAYDFDHDSAWDEYFMTMELLEGRSLEHLLQACKGEPYTPVSEAYRIIEGIAMALDFAHRRKPSIVHSDIKPSNVFVTDDGTVKVLDFGIARVMRQGDSQAAHTVFGTENLNAFTVPYASCEILESWPPHPCDDVYALACIAYKLLSGAHPFGPLGERYGVRYARDTGMAPAPIKSLDKRQRRALARGLAFARKDRTPTVAKFLEEILPRRTPLAGKPAVAVAALAALCGLGLAAHQHYGNPHRDRDGLALLAPVEADAAPPADREELAEARNGFENAQQKGEAGPARTAAAPRPMHEMLNGDGGTKTAEQRLIELMPSLNGLPLHLPKRVFREKEAIPLSVEVPAAGSLHVFYFQPGEPISLLFPNAAVRDSRVDPGAKPIEKLIAMPPVGNLSLIAIADPGTLNLFQDLSKDKSRVKGGFATLSQEELLDFLRSRLKDEKALVGHADLAVVR